MPKLDTNILQITKPVIKIDTVKIINDETVSHIVGSFFPYIVINNFEFPLTDVLAFDLNLDSFLPTINITVQDNTTHFMARFFPKDGDVISFYLRANNEKTFKPIRIDFNILEIVPRLANIQNNNPTIFQIVGEMKVPGLLTEFSESFGKLSSYDLLLELSQKLELGFASNDDSTDDVMQWINPMDTRIKFINDVVANSYKDDNSFFTAFIDSYYTLNFVNVNKLFTTDTEVLDSEAYVINFPDLAGDKSKTEGALIPLVLSNHEELKGSSKYISAFTMFNNAGEISLINGYKRYSQFYDIESHKYVSEFVDPLTTEGTDDQVHLKGRYIADESGKNFVPEGIADKHVKYKYVGKQDARENGNVHKNFTFATIQNYQNMQEIYKMGLNVSLDIADMTLTKYQVIPVFIFENEAVSKQIENDSQGLDKAPKLNKFMSGSYVITEIFYTYRFPGPIKQHMKLLKREYVAIK